mgnify:CR=1 FL=1
MATHDYVIANQSGAAFRTDLNNALAAIVSNNSNSSQPATRYAYQWWVDTTANIVKIRNSANDAWINLFTTAGGIDVDAASDFNADVAFRGLTAGRDIVFDKSDNALEFTDNAKAVFGTGADLEVFHDASNSILKNNNGFLLFKSNSGINLGDASDTDNYLKTIKDGAVELYFDGAKKFETTSTGIQMSGDIKIQDNHKIKIGAGEDLQIFHDGTDSRINNTTGKLMIKDDVIEFVRQADDTVSFKVNEGGATELYHNHNKKFETSSAGALVTGQGEALRIQGSDGDTFMKILGNTNVNVILGQISDQGFVGNSTNHDFFIRTNNANRITISNSGTLSGDLNDTSDENLKENIVSISDGAISDIKKLRPVNFDWKDSEKAKNQSGFIAQELKTIFPNLVVGKEYDETKADLGYAIKTSGVVAHLTKAFQEAITKIEVLEVKVAALEAA